VADAEFDTAYYGEMRYAAKGTKIKEFGVVTRFKRSGRGDSARFVACCQAFLESGEPCTRDAQLGSTRCFNHGGGSKAGDGNKRYCTHCKTTFVVGKRTLCNGGNGLCLTCEDYLEAQAEANGTSLPPERCQRWEEVVFSQLLPLITYACGASFPPDQRDERKGGGVGTSKAVLHKRECDTTTNRFPDSMWILRNEDGCAVLVVIIEVDEDSHRNREPVCESGKIYDTWVSVQSKIGKEGVVHGASVVKRPMVPYVVIKVNPNSYDGPRTNLSDRVKAVAKLANHYIHMDAAARAQLHTLAPIVHVMYYHSKEGAKNLAHFASVAPKAGWEYKVH
jgi:hypothetical protein